MKYIFQILILYLFFSTSWAQQQKIDSISNLEISYDEKLGLLKDFAFKTKDNSTLGEYKVTIRELINFARKSDNKKIEPQALQSLAEKYKRARKLDSAIVYISQSIQQFKNIKHDSLLIKAYNSKAGIFNYFQKFDSAKVYYQKAIKIAEQTKHLELLGYAYNGYSTVLSNLGNDIEAINIEQKSLNISEEHNFKTLEIINLIGLGWKLLKVGNNEKSLEYLEDALEKYDPNIVIDKQVRCDILRFLALNYRRLGNYELVNKYGTLGVECFENTGNIMLASDVLNTMGASLLEQGKYFEAIPLFERLIEKDKSINSQIGINFGKINLSSALINTKRPNEGRDLLLEILKDTINVQFLPKRIEKVVYQNLAEAYELSGNFKEGLQYHRKFKFLEDSLNTASNLKQITDIDTKYQTEKKEKELAEQKIINQEQELQTQRANTRNWLLAIGLLAVLVSAFFIWRRYKSEAKAKQTINQQKQRIEKLQKEFHHRLKNDFRSINRFIGLVQKKFPDSEFQERLNELKNRVTSMFKVHEVLLREDDITQVKAQPYLLELSKNIESKYHNNNIKLICNINENETIVADKAIPFGIILNEFVTNSYKYAFDENGGEISINFISDENNHSLTLKDNGKGLPKGFNIDNLNSLGLSIIPMFADLHEGSYELDGSNGVKLTLTLPKKVA